jgi:hypothetical protein
VNIYASSNSVLWNMSTLDNQGYIQLCNDMMVV